MLKTCKLEIVNFNDREKRLELYELAKACQAMANRIWQLWECWHVANNSRQSLIADLEAHAAWKAAGKKTRGERPKFQTACWPKTKGTNQRGNERNLLNDIYADISTNFPQVHARVRVLLLSKVTKAIGDTKSAKGTLPGWQAILLNHQSRPSFTRPLPIPFDKAQSRINPLGDQGDSLLAVRLHRDERGKSMAEEFTLRTSGRQAAKYVKPIIRMASGEWTYKGSSLFYDGRKKKWFALLTCEIPPEQQVQAVPGRKAFLASGYHSPIQLRIAGQREFLRGFGSRQQLVPIMRKQLLTQRWARQANYRIAGSANKGHGRNRALGPVFLLSQRWKDFTKRYNHTVTSGVVDWCRREGVGELCYFQPTGGRFLDMAGKVDDREDSTGWDYFQIKAMLEYKCQSAGIKFVSRKRGVKATVEPGLVAIG